MRATEIQRRNGSIAGKAGALNEATSTAHLYVCENAIHRMYYRTDAVDLDNLPTPQDDGWVFLGEVAHSDESWSIAGAATARTGLGVVHWKRNDLDQALDCLQRALGEDLAEPAQKV